MDKAKEIKVSVIVPVYNVEEWIDECVQSIRNQTHTNLDIILVDDGSKDSSGSLCDKYAKTDQRIKVIHKANGGLSDARNAGLDVAIGKYVSFIDGDDFVEPEYVEFLLDACLANNCEIANCGMNKYTDGIKKPIYGKVAKYEKKCSGMEFLKYMFYQKYSCSSCNKIYRADAIQSIRFPKVFSEDVPFLTEVLQKNISVSFTPHYLYNYRTRTGSLTTVFSSKQFELLSNARRILIGLRNNENSELRQAAEIHCNCMYANLMVEMINKKAYLLFKKEYADIVAHIRNNFLEIIGGLHYPFRTRVKVAAYSLIAGLYISSENQ